MRKNGNKIWHIKYKRSLKLAAAMLAVSLAFPMAAQAKAWDFENGSYVDASGAPVEGAVAKGITVTKYQNRANKENGIDWGKVAADGVGFAMIRIGYYKDLLSVHVAQEVPMKNERRNYLGLSKEFSYLIKFRLCKDR